MTLTEFSDQFDVLYNNITANQAPGLTEYEKSVFLTKAQNEIVKNYFTANSKGNNIGQGYDDSAKRQADFSCLMKTSTCDNVDASGKLLCENTDRTQTNVVDKSTITFSSLDSGTPTITLADLIVGIPYPVTYTTNNWNVVSTDKGAAKVVGFPYEGGYITRNAAGIDSKIDSRSTVYTFPSDAFIIVNESIITTGDAYLQVIPLRYDEYTRYMSKPYKRPLKNQAWRLLNTGIGNGITATKYAEIVVGPQDIISVYKVRYLRTPLPIILSSLALDGLSIGGYKGCDDEGNPVLTTDTVSLVTKGIDCELDPILHEEILQRAVELAKVAWTATGQDNAQMVLQAGQRSE